MSYQYSDGGHEIGAGEEDGPVDFVALVAPEPLGARADVASVADVVISVLFLLQLFIILFTDLVSER